MALAGDWRVAAVFILLERIGRAIRKPTVEAMLSYTTAELGRGRVYAVNSAMDDWYAVLLVSSLLALAALTVARGNFPLPPKRSKAGRSRHR